MLASANRQQTMQNRVYVNRYSFVLWRQGLAFRGRDEEITSLKKVVSEIHLAFTFIINLYELINLFSGNFKETCVLLSKSNEDFAAMLMKKTTTLVGQYKMT